MIRVQDLVKKFQNLVAVDQVSMQVREKEIFGLVGPDGAGKTTLIRVICGLLEADQGEVRLLGLTEREREKRKETGDCYFGYMPQRFSLYGDLTVMENLIFFGAMYRLNKEVVIRRAEEILELTNLLPFKNRLADQLSGGMKQKLALTCALVTRPRLLILDEPTYGVDPESRKEFWKILYGLNQEGLTILVSTPYMDEAELCTRIAFMNEGRFTAVDTPQALKANFAWQVWELESDCREGDLFLQHREVLDSALYGHKYRLIVSPGADAAALLPDLLAKKGYSLTGLQQVAPSMEDVFVMMAGGEGGGKK